MNLSRLVAVALSVTGLLAGVAEAQQIADRAIPRVMPLGGRVRPQPGANGFVNLPYVMAGKAGQQWMIYNGGWFRQAGNMMVYSQGAQLLVDGNSPNMNNNQGRVDADTGELVLENMQGNNLTMTRRVRISPEDGSLRVIDTFASSQGGEQQVNVTLQTSLNFGVQTATNVADPKAKDQTIAWVAMAPGQRAAMEWYGGVNGSVVQPSVNWQQGNNAVSASYTLAIPAGKPVSIVHVHQTAATQQAATDYAEKINPAKLLADVPKELRLTIVNVRSSLPFLGDLELLRGDALDVVELRNGDRVAGTLADASFKLAAPNGPVEVQADRVLGMFNVGEFKPRQLVVTTDGQIIGGTLAKETIDVLLPGGQTTAIPLRQVARVGLRKRAGEAEEITLAQPHVLLREGDRIAIRPPTEPVEVATRYGPVKVPAAAIASISFQEEGSSVHVVQLTDGTTLSGLVTAAELPLSLADGTPFKLPVAGLLMLKVATGEQSEAIRTDDSSVLNTLGGDALVGTLNGELQLVTTFDVLKLDAAGVRGLTRAKPLSNDVQVVTWDGAMLSGQLANDRLDVRLTSGVQLSVPIGLVVSYAQPRPQPSATMLDRIRAVVIDLNAEDWKQRDVAEAQLVALGPSVAGVLKQLRNSQPAEVQQRIDSVLKQVEGKK